MKNRLVFFTAIILFVTPTLAYASFNVGVQWNGSIGGTQFSTPNGIAVDLSSGTSAGDVYVADQSTSLVQKFSSNGVFIASWDGSNSGNNFNSPADVAVDSSSGASSGDVYVLDTGNGLVDKFSASGTFITSFDGSDSGTAFSFPQDIAVDSSLGSSSGDIYVSNQHVIYKFSPTGVYITKFDGSNGGTQFSNPGGIAVDASGNVYVTDQNNNLVQKFDSNGAFIASFSDPTNPNFENLEHLSIDASGDMYIAGEDDVMFIFDSSGNELGEWNGPINSNLKAVAVNSSGAAYVADNNNGIVYKVSHTAGVPVLSTNAPSSVTVSTLVLNGAVTDGAPVTARGFAYGSTASYGATSTENGSFFSVPFSTLISSPSLGTIYHYRSYATNGSGTAYGNDFASTPYFEFSWGGAGSGNGTFSQPDALAVSKTTGDVFVLDASNNQVLQKFDSSGGFLLQLNVNNQYLDALAVDSSDDIYVLDNNHVKKFDSEGQFITQWGGAGSGNGTFNNPEGLSVDQSTGYVYVVDTGNNLIQKFGSTGAFITQWGGSGSGSGSFSRPVAASVSSSGNVYVSDSGNGLVQEFSSTGGFVRQWDGSIGGTKFINISGITIDALGNIYVNDLGTGSGDIQKFDSNGNFILTIPDSHGEIGSIDSDSLGDLYMIDGTDLMIDKLIFTASPPVVITQPVSSISATGATLNGLIQAIPSGDTATVRGFVYGLTTAYGATTTASGSFGAGGFTAPLSGLSVGTIYHVKAFATDAIGTSYGSDQSFITYTVSRFGGQGSGNGLFNHSEGPQSIIVDPSTGDIYVADDANNLVQKFDSKGNFLDQMDGTSQGGVAFYNPIGIALDSAGDLYVCNSGDGIIQKFDSGEHFLASFGGVGTGSGLFENPWGITIDQSTGDIYVSDAGNDLIQKLGPSGNFIAQYGGSGNGHGLLDGPEAVALDSQGNMYVADEGNNLIQKLSPTGTFITQWGGGGFGDKLFLVPEGITADSHDNIYVADTNNGLVKRFDTNGNFEVAWVVPSASGNPHSEAETLTVDSSGNVYVSEDQDDYIYIYNMTSVPVSPPSDNSDTNPSAETPAPVARIYGGGRQQGYVSEILPTVSVLSLSVQTTVPSPIPVEDLSFGTTSADVKNLQQFLNTHLFAVAETGAGSAGNETDFFGSSTEAAVIKFQKTFDIIPAVGYFGPKTRQEMILVSKS